MRHPKLLVMAMLCLTLAGCTGLIRERIFKPTAISESSAPVWSNKAPDLAYTTTADGLNLQGYFFSSLSEPKDIVIYFHGNGHNQLVAATRAEPLFMEGRAVLVTSYRGYGGNSGKPSESGLYMDADAWVKKAKELAPNARIHLFGHSLGGAIALEMAARHKVHSVATLGTFASMTSMVPKIARGFLKDNFDNLAKLPKIEEPVYLYHGTSDTLVPFSATQSLKAAGRNVTVIPIEKGSHHVNLKFIAENIWANFLGNEPTPLPANWNAQTPT